MDEVSLTSELRLRPITPARVLSLRYRQPDEDILPQELMGVGLPWPKPLTWAPIPGQGWMVRLSPRHSLAVGCDAAVCAAAVQRFAPGCHPSVMAIDISEGQSVLELRGPGIEALMRRVMEAWPDPASGQVIGGARVADVPVVVVDHDAQAWALVVERTLDEHLRSLLQAAAQAAVHG